MNQFKNLGMQVHAVPDDERAVDASGKRLPWAYSYAESAEPPPRRQRAPTDAQACSPNPPRKQPTERGPFGRATNRRASTRKGTTPAPGAPGDRVQSENFRYYDEIFGKLKAEQDEANPIPARIEPAKRPSLATRPTLDTLPTTSPPTAQQSATAAPTTSASFKEPTEVLVSGFGADHQYQALSFYEKASGGHFYEDYDREPAEPRFASALSSARGAIPKTLPRDAIRKINTYQGGEHWIKVTFDSPHAATLACHASPHVIQGYSVKCEPWNGAPPIEDLPQPATNARDTRTINIANARTRPPRRAEFRTMPNRMPSVPSGFAAEDDPFLDIAQSTTGSTTSTLGSTSATASASTVRGTSKSPSSLDDTPPAQRISPLSIDQGRSTALPTTEPPAEADGRASRRFKGRRLPPMRTADAALKPQDPWHVKRFGWIPIVGPVFFGGATSGTMIGAEAPRKEDGSFDADKASLWWNVMFFLDRMYGSDLCGLNGDD